MLDYKLVEALARVIEEGGFERAARALGLTQSAVSQRVRALEKGRGQVLLNRTTPPQPTSAGRSLIRHYRQVRLLEKDLDSGSVMGTGRGPTVIPIGVNSDSIASWFLLAIRPLMEEDLRFDLRLDDQEQTHRSLKDGDLVGCISTDAAAARGCRTATLGGTNYRLLATPEFRDQWFPDGFTQAGAASAPAVCLDRNDHTFRDYCEEILGSPSAGAPAHRIPSPPQRFWMVAQGHAYGMVPDWQSGAHRADGRLVELVPDRPHRVALYWHCWNIESTLLRDLTERLLEMAGRLDESGPAGAFS